MDEFIKHIAKYSISVMQYQASCMLQIFLLLKDRLQYNNMMNGTERKAK